MLPGFSAWATIGSPVFMNGRQTCTQTSRFLAAKINQVVWVHRQVCEHAPDVRRRPCDGAPLRCPCCVEDVSLPVSGPETKENEPFCMLAPEHCFPHSDHPSPTWWESWRETMNTTSEERRYTSCFLPCIPHPQWSCWLIRGRHYSAAMHNPQS